jgi:MFS family permease
MAETTITPWRVLLPVGLGTGLSLMGDSSLYAVLPTHVAEAGVTLASVGILLSANRFIRLGLNGPAGLAYDRWPRRPLFVAALFIGAASTAIYALTQGFWPLLAGRLLWGLAWSGIWVGGNTIVLDITAAGDRGRWIGLYQISFFLGASGGAISGGLLTDGLGYHGAMGIGAGLTLLGGLAALFLLPETRGWRQSRPVGPDGAPVAALGGMMPVRRGEYASVIGLLGVNRLVIAGVLNATLGLLLLQHLGESMEVAGYRLGVATLTGLGLGTTALVAMGAAPVLGGLSDRAGSRWGMAAGGLLPGVAGFGLLAAGAPLAILAGLLLTPISGGSNQSLATALMGDLSGEQRRGRQMGILFTCGDLASAIGPPLAYLLIPRLGLPTIYLLSGGLFGLMLLVAWRWAVKDRPRVDNFS